MRISHDLKSYVRKFPDNQMAWYLLGKEYEKDDQQAKANYCFERSGGVFEAFEHSKAPTQIWMEYKEKWIEMEEEKRRKKTRRKSILLGLLCIILILIPSAAAPGMERGLQFAEDWVAEMKEDGVDENKGVENDISSGITEQTAVGMVKFTAVPVQDAKLNNEMTGHIINNTRYSKGHTVIVDILNKGDYLYWKLHAEPAYRMTSNGAGGAYSEALLDKSCLCMLDSNPALIGAANEWASKQELALTLISAVSAFKEMNDRFPEQFDELVQPFPDNIMGGSTPELKKIYPEILELLKHKEKDSAEISELALTYPESNLDSKNSAEENKQELTSFDDTWGGEPIMQSPLQIRISKKTHRLSVLSGNIVLRSYEVGLGGERTPEGKFVITDKVVNPNGTSTGEFGSRGMQLSDTNYAIHGTNKPESVGKDESLGCIRMIQEDVEELFALVPKGTQVTVEADSSIPQDLWVPAQAEDRYKPKLVPGQTNPDKTYHWLD